MINIRQGVFESNSSSCHSICISKTPIKNCDNRTINFRLSGFGWSEETCYNTEDYLYTAIVCSDLTPIEVEMYLDKLKKILDKHNIHYSFEPYKVVHSEYGDYCTCEREHSWSVGIDHAGEVLPLVDKLLDDENLLMRYLFGDSVIYTGNDNNCEPDSMCYCADETVWDPTGHSWVFNPNHCPSKYDYFFKGN